LARTETLRDTIGRTLCDAFPEVEILDRDVELGGGRHADLAALDAHGRLMLVIIAAGAGDETLLRTIDALAFARRELGLLASHFQNARLRTDLEPAVVVAASEIAPELRERLGGLDRPALRCFELRKIASASNTRTYLAEIALGTGSRSSDARGGAGHGGAHDPRPGDLVLDIERRVARIDADIERSQSGGDTEWRLGDAVLCTLSSSNAGLAARVPNVGALRVLESSTAAELFLDDVVLRYLELAQTGAAGIARGVQQAQPLVEPAALLTPEELAAFRDP
jgi:hypothetical protein